MKSCKGFALLVSALALASLSACATIGHNFDPSATDRLTPTISTLADAIRELGKPTTEATMADGQKIFVWQYAQGTAFGTGKAKAVAIIFDAAGKMVRVSSRTETNLK